jgi:hypothetical protein
VKFLRVTIRASETAFTGLANFYGDLGFPVISSEERVSIATGETTVEFVAAPGEPFYHFALLVPGKRFDAALEWARAHTTLLPHSASGGEVFDFEAWHAYACYFHDPAGNIVELIAHRGVDENDTRGDFEATEIVGVSELGLVGDPRAMAKALQDHLRLELWDGAVDEPGDLAFVGERARTLILAPPGRGWLPTGRAAERHEVDALLSGPLSGEADLDEGRYRIHAEAA